MPIYEYHCDACGHEFEVMQKMSDGPVRTCEVCKARKVKRLISHSSFQLKGGGWYSDLYSSSSKSSGSKTTTKPAASTSSASTSTSSSTSSSSSSSTSSSSK